MRDHGPTIERSDPRNSVHKPCTNTVQLETLIGELVTALRELLGDRPDIQSGTCIRCGRNYQAEPELEGADCPSDDCPGYRARHLCAHAGGGAS